MPMYTPKKRRTKKKRKGSSQFVPIDLNPLLNAVFGALGFATAGRASPVVVSPIPPELFRKMLMLCHPDKHGNSETAKEVTLWLLEERKKSK